MCSSRLSRGLRPPGQAIAARRVLPGAGPVLLARADEREALIRFSLGDLRAPAELAARLPAARRGPLLARIALAAGDHHAAHEHLRAVAPGDLTPRPALEARTGQPEGPLPGRGLAAPLTPAELRVLKLLPTSSYLQIAETLYISRNTVKVHLRAVYQKLEVASCSQAIERAVDLSLL